MKRILHGPKGAPCMIRAEGPKNIWQRQTIRRVGKMGQKAAKRAAFRERASSLFWSALPSAIALAYVAAGISTSCHTVNFRQEKRERAAMVERINEDIEMQVQAHKLRELEIIYGRPSGLGSCCGMR